MEERAPGDGTQSIAQRAISVSRGDRLQRAAERCKVLWGVLAVVSACSSEGGGSAVVPPPMGTTGTAGAAAGPAVAPGAAGGGAASQGPRATPPAPGPTATAGAGANPSTAGGSAAPAGAGMALPNDVCGVLQANGCISCHQKQLQGGAPMPLQWRADFIAAARDGGSMSDKLIARVTDKAAPMPPVTTMRPMLSDAHVNVLRGWVQAGMPGVDGKACDDVVVENETDVEWARQPWPEEECEYVMTIGAHGEALKPLAQDQTPYEPPEIDTSYHCFYEAVPWGDKKVHALATRIRVEGDDASIVHHTVLSALSPGDGMSILGGTPPTGPGDHLECPNPSGSTVAVWAPGPHKSVTFPKESGLLMPSGTSGAYLELQIHYNNVKAGMKSRVSFDICATTKLRENTAGVHWLGYENAVQAVPLAALGPELQPRLDNQGNGVAVGKCVAKERARILWMAPHMHELGKHAKVEILRADGTVQMLHDAPFDFSEQTAYFYDDLWIEAGESIRTTCTWNTGRPIVFGFASNEEMCFAYTLAYPVGALMGQGAEKGVVGGELNCAGAM